MTERKREKAGEREGHTDDGSRTDNDERHTVESNHYLEASNGVENPFDGVDRGQRTSGSSSIALATDSGAKGGHAATDESMYEIEIEVPAEDRDYGGDVGVGVGVGDRVGVDADGSQRRDSWDDVSSEGSELILGRPQPTSVQWKYSRRLLQT